MEINFADLPKAIRLRARSVGPTGERWVATLEETGQGDNTLVIFMSDHGEMLGDHGIYLKGPHFYEGVVHVPVLLRWPGKIRAGERADALV